VTTSTFSVNKSTVTISIDNMDAGLFTNFSTTVSGTISDGDHAVWINGTNATIHDDHTWNASGVPVNQGGTATLHVRAIANSDNGGNGTPPPENQALNNITSRDPSSDCCAVDQKQDVEVPAFIRVKDYLDGSLNSGTSFTDSGDVCTHSESLEQLSINVSWTKGDGGTENLTRTTTICKDNAPFDCTVSATLIWDADDVPSVSYSDCDGTSHDCGGTESCPFSHGPPEWYWEHCDVHVIEDQGDIHWDYSRYGQTRIELHTGGKSLSH